MFIVILIILLILIILFGSIKVKISTIYRKRTFYAIKIYFLGIKVYSVMLFIRYKGGIDVSLQRVMKNGYKQITTIKEEIISRKRGGGGHLKLSELLKHSRVLKSKIELAVGCEDAANTAILCGILRNILPYIIDSRYNLYILPDFAKSVISLKIQCIIQTNTAQIIFK